MENAGAGPADIKIEVLQHTGRIERERRLRADVCVVHLQRARFLSGRARIGTIFHRQPAGKNGINQIGERKDDHDRSEEPEREECVCAEDIAERKGVEE